VKTSEDTPILSAEIMFIGESSFRLCKVYADIRYASRARRRQLIVGWSKAANFQ